MAPTYTITSGDVASASGDSSLVAGVVFDWGSQIISVPSSVPVVNAQWVVDHAKFAESTVVGMSRKKICDAYGKYKKGVDPETSLDILAGVEAILLDSWLISTTKTSGVFLVKDVYKPDGSYPIAPNPSVELRYQNALGLGLVQPSGEGGSTLTPAQIWQYGDRTLTSATNLVLSKGTHITGFNDLSLAMIEDSTILAKQSTVLSVQAALADIPTNPLLTTDSRLSNLGTIDTIYSLLGFKPGDALTASQTQHTTASGKRLLISISGDGTTTLTRSDP